MGIWTVLARENPGDTAEAAASRVVFVREKFSWVTLFFAPFVLLRFGLWLPFAAYVAVSVILGVAESSGVAGAVTSVVFFGFHLLLAFELPALRLRKLGRKGFNEVGVVIAPDREEAEYRFFSEWTGPRPASHIPPIRPLAPAARPMGQPGVIGAFPGA